MADPLGRALHGVQRLGPLGELVELGDATLVFYGASMLLAALRGYCGCEVQAVGNWLLGRDDQTGCALFWPIDHAERRWDGGAGGAGPAALGIHAELRLRLIGDQAAAERVRFSGSPTILVDGRDVEPGAQPPDNAALACRRYRHEHALVGQPAERWVRDALLAATGRTGATPAPPPRATMDQGGER